MIGAVRLKDIREGSIVTVRGCFGSGAKVKGVVTSVEEDIKRGEPGIFYNEIATENEHWAYLYQVTDVLTF